MVKSPYRRPSPTRTMKIDHEMKTENFCPSWPLWPPRIMTNKDPQPIQKIYPIIEFSEVSHSKGENILPYPRSLKFDPLSVLLTYSRYIFLSYRNLADSQKAYFVNGESTISYLLGMITIFINK